MVDMSKMEFGKFLREWKEAKRKAIIPFKKKKREVRTDERREY